MRRGREGLLEEGGIYSGPSQMNAVSCSPAAFTPRGPGSAPGRAGPSLAGCPCPSGPFPLSGSVSQVPKHLNPFSCQRGQVLLETGRVFRWRLLACPGQQQGEKGSLPSPPGTELGIGSPECFWPLSPKPAKTCLQRAPLSPYLSCSPQRFS